MEPAITTRTALLQALRFGPGYGLELVRRAAALSGGRCRLAPGSLYPALRALETARLVRAWQMIPGGRRGGRSRTYYDLTWRGVEAAEQDRRVLAGLARSPGYGRRPTPGEIERMRERLRLGAEVSEFLLGAAARWRRRVRRRR